MKKQLSRTFQRAVASLLACVMLAGCLQLPALAAGADSGSGGASTPELKLWYDEPASQTGTPGSNGSGTGAAGGEGDKWQQDTLPIGNGTIGATVYGEIGTERLLLNEQTLWSGGPSESRPNYIGGNIQNNGRNGAAMQEIQELFKQGDVAGARNKRSNLTGEANSNSGYGYYLPWGELRIATGGLTDTSTVTGYERWLTLDDALAGVRFTSGGVTYTREYLTSHPDNVLAAKLTASQSKTFTITLPSRQGGTTEAVGGDTLKLCGALTDNGLKYASFLKVVPADGTTVTGSGNSLTVTGTEFTLFFSAATDYKMVYPVYRTGETDAHLAERVLKTVTDAAVKGYAAVKQDHLDDYYSLYNRVSLNLGQGSTTKTTDALLSAYNNGTASESERRLLEVMLFQYGRYLTIASSRQDSQLPSNLQGIWNYHDQAPWHSDFHTNVNLQMNYWPTYSTNLAECADPVIRYVDGLREPGRVTAKIYAGIESTPENPENGFMAHTQNTPYGWTCPGSSFDWGWAPAGIAWMLQNCWEYYEYSGDRDYMKNMIYPMMKEYTRTYEQLLVDVSEYELGYEPVCEAGCAPYYASVPAYSPETGPTTVGNTFEHSLIWQLFDDTITAAEELNLDADKVGDEETPGTWKYFQAHLLGPIVVGDSGQIKEWYDETGLNAGGKPLDSNGNLLGADTNNVPEGFGHRHISHMLGLFPGDLVQTNEEWIEAARVSMNNRTFTSTGWGMGHRINVRARLREGANAYQLICDLFSSGMYVNLWDAHAPFQIDGNFGYTSGVAEMLMQSNMGFIDLLPALPDNWATGSYSGLVARGNFELSAAWADSSLTNVTILSKNGGECVVRYPNISRAVVKDAANNLIEFKVLEDDKISFPSAKGATYTITDIPAQNVSVVEDAAAYRATDNTAELFWTAKDGESYQVYRQITGGDILPVGEPTTKGSFLDETAYMTLGEMKYFISVNEAGLSDAIPLVDMRNQMIDDKDSSIVYTGSGWGTWGDSACYAGGIHFIESINMTTPETLDFTFYGTGIEVYGCPNTGWGTMTAAIDGSGSDVVNFRGPRDHTVSIYTKTGLERGVHTIKLTGVSGKIEFDAFKVLDTAEVETPEELTISTVGGVEKLWNAGDTVQFTANLEGVTWTATSSVTHATTCNYPEHKFSWNAGTQTLTAGLTDEVITVTATKGTQTASKQITITPKTTVTIIEDAINGTRNPAITWNGNWSPWTGEATKHHGGSKTENSTVGAWLQLDFEGTDVAVYGTIHFNNGAVSVLLDGEAKDDIHPCGDTGSTDLAQKKLAEYTGLTNGTHTLKLTVKAANNASGVSKSNFVLDFFEVHAPNPNAPQADLEDLKAAVAQAAEYSEVSYTEASWEPLATALATAGDYLNNTVNATQVQADAAAEAIRDAIKGLQAKPLSAPENVKTILVEGTAITLKWDAVTGATGYKVTVGSETYDAAGTTYRVTGLESGVEYSFTVKATNTSEESPASSAVTATTLDTVAPSQPAGLAWDESAGTLSWNASTDNVGVAGYKVLVNGAQQGGTQTETSKALTLSGTQNTVTVIAVDAAGNESVPGTLVVAPTYTVTVGNATVQGGKTRFKVGEAVTVNATIPAGHIFKNWTAEGITLSDADRTAPTLSFSMPEGDVSLTATVEEKNWAVTANLTNLYSDVNPGKTVANGAELTVKLTAYDPYKLPTSVQVVMGGQQLQSPWVTYDVTTGTITVREVTGDVVITAENAPQTPTGTTFTEADRFQLPTNVGDTTKLEAEYMVLQKGTTSALAAVYGPNFGNKQLKGFVAGDTVKLYYNAEYPGTYTLTLRYSSAQTADAPHKLNWSGENVEDQTNSVESTLENGTAIYSTMELEFTVTKEGPGMVEFTTAAPGGPDIDSMTFTLDKIDTTPVEEITLDETEVTLYLSGAADEDTAELTATVTPNDAYNQELRWSSSDSSVAYVTQDGVVGARSNGTATITATAMDGSGVTATATVTVKTRVSGTVTISGVPQYGLGLVASVNQISNQNAQSTLTYQWKRDGVAIDGATSRSYTVTEDDIDCTLTVTAFAHDPYVGAVGGTTSDPVTATKADGPDVVDTLDSVDCTSGENDDGKIIGLNAATSYQYKLVSGGDEDWKDIPAGSTEFTVPAPGSYHVRVKGTDTASAGAPSSTLTILAADATGNAVKIGTFTGGVVRSDINKANEGDTVTLTVLPKTGYQLVENSLKVNGNVVTVTDNSGTFSMPGVKATVTAEFELKTYEIDHSLENIGCDLEDHEVKHGAKPTITIYAEEGYDLPPVITVTMTETTAPFTDYEYNYEYNDDTVTGQITFTNGIPGGLTITGAGIKKSFPVIYALYGLSSADGARTVEYGAELSFTITPKTSYTLPDEISMTMGGEEFTDFTYTVADDVATVTIAEEKITGELAITAEGTSELPALALVEITGTAMVGRTLRAVATPSNVFPDYRWLRVDSEGNGSPIYGATNRTYVITTDDVGYTIKVAATGEGVKFGNTIYSAPTRVVENVNVVPVESVTVTPTEKTITAGGDPLQLNAVIVPSTASNKTVQWSSDNEAVASVTSSGVVYGKTPGTATITGTTVSGNKTATCEITVVAVSLPETASVPMGGTIDLTATVPDDLPDKNFTWTSGDTGVATVDENGTVTGVSIGSTTITVTTGAGFTATCTVSVTQPSEAKLSSLALSEGTLEPAFSADTTTYTANVANSVETVTVTAAAATDVADADVVVKMGGNVCDNGEVALAEGENVITVTVSKAGWTSTDYTITITRAAAETGQTDPLPVMPLPPTTTTTTTTTNPDGTTTTTVTDRNTGTVTETTKKDDGTVETVETRKDGTKTETTEKPDGTVEVVETRKDGTKTETTKNTDGSTEVVETKPDGTVTATNTDAEGGKVEKVTTPEKDVTVTVTDAEGEVLAKVELPAELPAVETRFADVPVNHWADEAIHNMAALEVVEGVGGDRFDMNGNMTRGALATVLSRLSDGQKGLKANFADVASDKWYADGIAWAARTGVVTGYSATEFGPNDPITREQLAVMLCRYARLLGMDTAADSAALDGFKDGSSTHSWAADSIAWCVDKGILKGMGNETLAPTATATRAQVAVMLQRFIDLVK